MTQRMEDICYYLFVIFTHTQTKWISISWNQLLTRNSDKTNNYDDTTNWKYFQAIILSYIIYLKRNFIFCRKQSQYAIPHIQEVCKREETDSKIILRDHFTFFFFSLLFLNLNFNSSCCISSMCLFIVSFYYFIRNQLLKKLNRSQP